MASTTSALFAAVASAFIAAHRSGFFDLISEVVVSEPPAPPPVLVECPPCRLGAQTELAPLREALARLALHRGAQVEVSCVVFFVLALTGLVTAVRSIFRLCCGKRGARIEATVLRISHGDRRVQRA